MVDSTVRASEGLVKFGTVGKNMSAGMKLRGSVGVAMMAMLGER